MTSRHPSGGSSATRFGAVLGACAIVAVGVSGCGGGWEHNNPADHFPHYKTFSIVLNVSDAGGNALGDAVVWVDGVAQPERTASSFTVLADGFPDGWRGFAANWIKGGFSVTLYNSSDVVDVVVTISKPGYYSQTTTFHIDDSLPAEVWGRDTFIMERSPNPAAAEMQRPRPKAKPGEVVGWSKPAKTSEVAGKFKVAAA